MPTQGRYSRCVAIQLDDVAAILDGLPGVVAAERSERRTWAIGGRVFAWERPFSKADLKRFGDETPPSGDILAMRVENLDAKEALLEMAPPGFFTIPHFDGYAAVLVELRRARVRDVRAAIMDAWRVASAAAPLRPRKRPPRPRKKK